MLRRLFSHLRNTNSYAPLTLQSIRSPLFSTSIRKPIDNPKLLETIVDLVSSQGVGTEIKLSELNLRLSHDSVEQILLALNYRNISALPFFDWVLKSQPWIKPSNKHYNLVIDNLGRLRDFNTMLQLLPHLSGNKQCLTDKAFGFVAVNYPSNETKNLVQKVIDVLNNAGGSCRGSGVHSLIKVLCTKGRFDLAVFVMEGTVRKTSYYHVLIAAKCRTGQFEDAQKLFDEMRMNGCPPCTSTYNYLLGCLFKNKRFVEGCELLETMEGSGYLPDPLTYEVILIHACYNNRTDFAVQVLDQMLVDGLRPRTTTHAAFIKAYYRCGRVGDAYKFVIEMSSRDVFSSNANYSLLAKLHRLSGRVAEAASVLHEMMEKMLKPNFPTYMKITKDLRNMERGDMASELETMYSKFD